MRLESSPRRVAGTQGLLTIKRKLIVSSELCTYLETPGGRHINQDEKHISQPTEVPRAHTRLDLVIGRCARTLAAAAAGDTSADRGLGHLVAGV